MKGKGLPPLCRQGSPLRSDPFLRYRCGMNKPLTAFTPLVKKALIRAFCESPLFLFFLMWEHVFRNRNRRSSTAISVSVNISEGRGKKTMNHDQVVLLPPVLRGLSGGGLCGVADLSPGSGKIVVSPAGAACCLARAWESRSKMGCRGGRLSQCSSARALALLSSLLPLRHSRW
jgi:hypothetical protein